MEWTEIYHSKGEWVLLEEWVFYSKYLFFYVKELYTFFFSFFIRSFTLFHAYVHMGMCVHVVVAADKASCLQAEQI